MKRTTIKTKDIKDSDITKIIEPYKEDIKFDDNTGEFNNDIKQMPFKKKMWI